MLVTGVVKYITGFWMWKIYKRTWWDYTGLFLNIDGYVCFRSVFTFALVALALIYLFVPMIDKLIKKMGKEASLILSLVVSFIMIVDFI